MTAKQGGERNEKTKNWRVASIASFFKTTKKQQFRKFLFVKIFTNSL